MRLAAVLRARADRGGKFRLVPCAKTLQRAGAHGRVLGGEVELAPDHAQRPQRHAQLKRGATLELGQHVLAERFAGGLEQLGGRGAVVRRCARRRLGVGGGGERVLRGARPGVQHLQQVPLHLARAAPDHGELDRAARAGQVRERLHHTDHAPPQRARQLPAAQRRAVHLHAGMAFVGGRELLPRAQAGGGPVGAREAPRGSAQPAEVLERVP